MISVLGSCSASVARADESSCCMYLQRVARTKADSEIFESKACVFKYRMQRASLEVFVVHGNGCASPVGMDIYGVTCVLAGKQKSVPLDNAYNFFWSYDLTHIAGPQKLLSC